jgi:hypothetical protein
VARVDQQLTNAIWEDQIRDNLNQLAGAHRNLLVNGGMEVWQRGAGSFTGNGVYTADRWQQTFSTGTLTTTQETSTVAGGSASALKAVATGGDPWRIEQRIETITALKGVTLSCSARIQQSVASAITLALNDGVGTTTSSSSATTGSFVTLTVTRTFSASASNALVQIHSTGAGTFYFDNVMLVIGPDAAPYQPLHPADELARCQRYYEVHGGVNNAMGLNAYQAAGANFGQIVQFAMHKGGVPTVTKNGTWGVVNCGQPAISAPSKDGYTLYATTTALGACSFGNNSTDDTVTAEWNS